MILGVEIQPRLVKIRDKSFAEKQAKVQSYMKNVASSGAATSSMGLKVKREREGERDQALSKTIKTRQLKRLK